MLKPLGDRETEITTYRLWTVKKGGGKGGWGVVLTCVYGEGGRGICLIMSLACYCIYKVYLNLVVVLD